MQWSLSGVSVVVEGKLSGNLLCFAPRQKKYRLFTLQTPRMPPCWRGADLSHNKDSLPVEREKCVLSCLCVRNGESDGKKNISLSVFFCFSDSQLCWRWDSSLLSLFWQVNKTDTYAHMYLHHFMPSETEWAFLSGTEEKDNINVWAQDHRSFSFFWEIMLAAERYYDILTKLTAPTTKQNHAEAIKMQVCEFLTYKILWYIFL